MAGARRIGGGRMAACAVVLAVLAVAALPAPTAPFDAVRGTAAPTPPPHPAAAFHAWTAPHADSPAAGSSTSAPPMPAVRPHMPPLLPPMPPLLPAAYADHMRACNPEVGFGSQGTSIEFITGDGTYAIGDVIQIRVTMGANVTFNEKDDQDHSTILMNTSRHALYSNAEISENNSVCYDRNGVILGCKDPRVNQEISIRIANRLVYNYTVQAGEMAADLDYNDVNSLYWYNGVAHFVVPSDGNDEINCQLAEPGADGSLSHASDVAVDGIRPTAQTVRSNVTDGLQDTGTAIGIDVTFSEPVVVVGAPRIPLETGSTDGYAVYSSGGGGDTLTFEYTVEGEHFTADLDYKGAIDLNGGTIRDVPGNDANLTLPAPYTPESLGGSGDIRIDLDVPVPTVTNVTSTTPDGSYNEDDTIQIVINFSRPVTVSGTPTLELSTAPARNASYVSGAPGATLVFDYDVTDGDSSDRLSYAGRSALKLAGAATIAAADSTGDPAFLLLPALDSPDSLGVSKNIKIDTADPSVDLVYSPDGNASYRQGETVRIAVNLTEPVTVTGTPQILLDLDGGSKRVDFTSLANGGRTLHFDYAVAPGDNSRMLAYDSASALEINDAMIMDAAGNALDLELPEPGDPRSLSHSNRIAVDTEVPRVEIVYAPDGNASYRQGGTVRIAVNLTEPVTVTGTPRIVLALGSGSYADYTMSDGRTLHFEYTVAGGRDTDSLTYTNASALDLNGATIADAAGNAADLELPEPGAAKSLFHSNRIAIDTNPPRVENIYAPAGNASYKGGDTVRIALNFSEPVYVSTADLPELMVANRHDGGRFDDAPYASGNGTRTLVFEYTVQQSAAGQLVHHGARPLGANSALIRDAAGNGYGTYVDSSYDPDTTYYIMARTIVTLDNTSPSALSASSPNSTGAYGSGSRIAIEMTFSEAVYVRGSPSLALNSGGSASYGSGNGSSTLVFLYMVGDGENAANLDYAGIGALDTAGVANSIRDAAGNDVVSALPAPDAGGLLGAMMPIAIDTAGPTVSSAAALNMSGAYMANERIAINVTFSEPVLVTGEPLLELAMDGDNRQAAYTAGNDSATLTFVHAIQDGDSAANLNYAGETALTATGGASIRDAVGNDAVLGMPAPDADGLLGAMMPIAIDTAGPTVSSAAALNMSAAYGIGDRIAINVTFSEPVVVEGTPLLAMETGDTDQQAAYAAGNNSAMLTFVYRVMTGDTATDLDYVDENALTLSGGASIKDAAGNDAVLELPSPGDDVGLIAGANPIEIDTTGARIVRVTSDTPDGAYTENKEIDVKVAFNEAVVVGGTGTPTMALAMDSEDRQAQYNRGRSTATELVFLYAVQPGDNSEDLDYNATNAIELGGATIQDARRNTANLTLPEPGSDDSLAGSKDIAVDTVPPRAESATSLNRTGDYMAGERMAINVTFNEPVVVEGTPLLAMETGATDRQAAYIAGNGSAMLTFLYTVRAGDNSDDLDYANETALTLNGGASIKDAAGNSATLTLPEPAGDGLLGAMMPIAIDTADPRVLTVTSPNMSGSYGINDKITIAVNFTEIVLVWGEPSIWLDVQGATGADRYAVYKSGSGSTTLTFEYTVRGGHTAENLDYRDRNSLGSNLGVITDAAGNDAVLTLPRPGTGLLAAPDTIRIDTMGAGIARVTSAMDNNAYPTGAVINITVVFSENVIVNDTMGKPMLTLETGETDRKAVYDHGNGTDMLTFLYTVQDGDNSGDLDYNATNAIDLNGATVRDEGGNDAILTLPPPGDPNSLYGTKNIVIDTIAPAAVSASSPNANSAYKAGDTIAIAVTFDDWVQVTGTPLLALETGDPDGQARYDSGDGGPNLTFLYEIRAGDNSGDLDYNATNAIDLDGGSIADFAGNPANLTLPEPGEENSLAHSKNIRVDTTAPLAGSVSSLNRTGAYMAGERMAINVTFSEPVVVTGMPVLGLELDATNGQAGYDTGSGSAMLTFVYTVQAGDNADNLDYAGATALTLGPGDSAAIKDLAGNNATLALTEPDGDGLIGPLMPVVIDTTAPTALSASSSNVTTMYTVGAMIAINVTFDEPVFVEGTPLLAMETGNTDQQAEYAAGSGSAMLTFVYTVQPGDTAANLDYVDENALTATGGASIKDAAGNDAVLGLVPPGADGLHASGDPIEIDTTGARIVRVTSDTPDGAYMAGEVIDVKVVFNEAVVVGGAGMPLLTLETGETDRRAEYDPGRSTATELAFLYAVQPGDNSEDLDYNATNAIELDGATIQDTTGNDAMLTLPEPGGDDSLAGSKDIAIDTVSPVAGPAAPLNGTGAYMQGERIAINVTFSEPVVVAGEPRLELELDGANREAAYTAGSGSRMLTFVYTVRDGDTAANLGYAGTAALTLGPGDSAAIKDPAGNNATLALPEPGGDGLIGPSMPIEIDTTAPTAVRASSPNSTGTYGTGARIAINVTFSEPVDVEGTPLLALAMGETGRQAGYAAGSGSHNLTFVYTVIAGDEAMDLDYAGSGALTAAGEGASIRDAAGNNANRTLPPPGGGLLAGPDRIEIDAEGAGVQRVTSDKPDGAYMAGEAIDIKVVFSEEVAVTGTPLLALETGDIDRQARYNGDAGYSETLTFLYTVQPGDNSEDLNYNGTNALTLNGSSSTIQDRLGNAAALDLPGIALDASLAGSKSIVIDTLAPAAESAASLNRTGAYMKGERMAINVTFSEPVVVAGMPLLAMETGETDRQAEYTAGNGSAMLTFLYIVQDNDTAANLDYADENALTLGAGNSSAITDMAGNNATLALPPPGTDGLIGPLMPVAIDTTAPMATMASSPNATGTYVIGDKIAVNVNFTEAVIVEGEPRLALETGNNDRQARYSNGSNSAILTFVYTVRTGDNSTDLDYANSGALTAGPGASIRDAAGNNANLTLPPPGSGLLAGDAAIMVNTTGAGVLRVTSDKPDRAYMAGEAIDVMVVFSENVTVGGEGAPLLALETGDVDRQAQYKNGSGSATLTFLYTVQEGDNSPDLNYANDTALTPNGSTIRGDNNADASLFLPPVDEPESLAGSKAIVVDTVAPSAESVLPLSGAGMYRAGAMIAINVTFSEPVRVTGMPLLELELDGDNRQANYTAGGGSAMLTFLYTVQDGDAASNLDYAGPGALTFNGGTIKDRAGNDAVLETAAPGQRRPDLKQHAHQDRHDGGGHCTRHLGQAQRDVHGRRGDRHKGRVQRGSRRQRHNGRADAGHGDGRDGQAGHVQPEPQHPHRAGVPVHGPAGRQICGS